MKHSYAYILLLGLPVLLPSLTSCGQKPVTDGGLISVQYEKLPQGEDLLPAIVLDSRTGKVSRRTVIDDILTMDETSPSFKCGYLAESYSPEYFIETTAKALEEGNLSNAARKRISTILKSLGKEDNNVIMLAPLK